MNSDSTNHLSPEPINPLTNDATTDQPTQKKQMSSATAMVVVLVAILPIFLIAALVINGLTIKDNSGYHDFKSYLESRYGAVEEFSYMSDGNTYMGHNEKIYRSSRTNKSFTVVKTTNGFEDNYWKEAYGYKIDDYLEDVLKGVMLDKVTFVSDGKLDGGGSIPDSTEAIAMSSKMAIDVVAAVDCAGAGNDFCDDIEANGVDTKALSEKIEEALSKKDVKGVRSVRLEVSNYGYSGECPEGITEFDHACAADIYSR